MARKQTRRSVSITGDTYTKLDSYCKENEVSKSRIVQELLNEFLSVARRELIKECAERVHARQAKKGAN